MGPRDQKPVWQQVAEYLEHCPNGAGRAEVAKAFGIHKTTATEHLDKCVERERAHRVYTWVRGNSRGWVYYRAVQDVPDLPSYPSGKLPSGHRRGGYRIYLDVE